MKKIKLALAAFALAATIVSCGGKKEGASASGGGLDGTWEVVKAEGDYADMNMGTKYEFEGDKIVLSGAGIKTPGKFRTSNDTIIARFDGGGIDMTYTFKMQGEQLVIKPMGSNQTLYLDSK